MGLCGKVVFSKREKLAGVSLRSMWFRRKKIAVSDGRTGSGFFIHSVKGLVRHQVSRAYTPPGSSSDLVNSYLIYICIVA